MLLPFLTNAPALSSTRRDLQILAVFLYLHRMASYNQCEIEGYEDPTGYSSDDTQHFLIRLDYVVPLTEDLAVDLDDIDDLLKEYDFKVAPQVSHNLHFR